MAVAVVVTVAVGLPYLKTTVGQSEVPDKPYEQPVQESPEELEQIRQEFNGQWEPDLRFETVSGLETMGKPIIVAGKELAIPADVYTLAYVVAIMCDPSPKSYCPQVPYYVLAYADNPEMEIGIIDATGEIFDGDNNATQEVFNRFTWLYDALGQEKPR